MPDAPHVLMTHAGDVGDVIYALPCVRNLQVELRLVPSQVVREPFCPAKAAKLGPLLARQPYISEATFGRDRVGVRLDRFRQTGNVGYNISQWHANALHIEELDTSPWLTADRRCVSAVVVNRTARYQNPRFPWRQVLKKFKDRVFVGLKEEHEAFRRQFGDIDYHATADWDEAAAAINGCDVFVGNQSACCAIAVGLGKRFIQETYLPMPNCQYDRDALYVFDDRLDWGRF